MAYSAYEEKLEAIKIIKGEHIRLRRFSIEDAQDIVEYARDENVTQFLTWESFHSLEKAEEVIKNIYLSRPGIYAIEHQGDKKCIGAIDLRLHVEDHKASFGYVLNRNYWNRGIMTEALNLLLECAFNYIGVNRVESTYYVGNEGSGRVMEKCGMKYEGLALQEAFVRGRFVDVIHYGILKSEYQSIKER